MKKIVKSLVKFIYTLYSKIKIVRLFYLTENEQKSRFNDLILPKLTEEEKQIIINKWGRLTKNIKQCFYEFRVYKQIYGFDSNFVPLAIYKSIIINHFNPINDRVALSNKSLTPMYLRDINQPRTILNSINGILYNEANEIIDLDEAINVICKQEEELIAKPSVDTACGKGVIVMPKNKDREIIGRIIQEFKNDFIIQKKVKQSEELSQLNETSLNTFRVTSIMTKNNIYVTSICLKIGKKGALCDNLGFGGIIVGVNKDGTLKEYGVDKNGNKIEIYNGYRLSTIKISMINNIIDIAINTHKHIPSCRIVGCDIAVDENNVPILIEANLKLPGITLEQMCTGPIFSSITEEIIEDVLSKKI